MENAERPSRSDWLLVTLKASKTGRLTPVQIQKSLFILSEEAKRYVGSGFYRFEPYDYGPFNASIYRDLDQLADAGEVEIERSPRWREYAITPAGAARARTAEAILDPRAVKFVKRVVDWVTSKSFPDLVRAIYASYPKYKANSVFNNG